jgi:excisionase family DNA binding protein
MIEFRVGRLAEQLGIHRNTVRNWIKSGRLDARQVPGQRYLIETEAFSRFLHDQQASAETIADLIARWSRHTPAFPPHKAEAQLQTSKTPREVPMSAKPVGAVMVVGGGIVGIQASLDLADSGYRVYLLEKRSGIGGGMSRLDKTFPTNDCAM